MAKRALTSDHIRNFIFGVEDSLVSTVGLISGIAAVGMERSTILVTGIILIFVEAFSMSVGSLLSDNSAREFEHQSQVSLGRSSVSAFIMFVSYFISGLIVLAPYLFTDPIIALPMSVALSLLALFLLGTVSARVSRTSYLRKGLTMLVIGGLAILVGILVGQFAQTFSG